MAVTKKEVISTAEELNKLLGLKPQIDTKLDPKEIKALIKEASVHLAPGDEISKTSAKVLKAFGIKIPKEVSPKAEKTDGKSKSEGKSASESKPKEKKASPPKREKTKFGHYSTSEAGKVDEFMLKNKKATADQVVKETGGKESNVKQHLGYLVRKGFLKKGEDGIFKLA